MNRLTIAAALLIAGVPSGCAEQAPGEGVDDESVTEAEDDLVIENALAANALAANALAANALAANALAANALAANALAVIEAPTAGGAAARQLLKYTVSCALDASESFEFWWIDPGGNAHQESYPGLLGLAPEWATGPLTDETHQRMVSACLAARVNYYEESVIISARSSVEPLRLACGSPELTQFPHIEGAFWGNLFADQPHLNACYRYGNADISRAAKRDCAVGHLETDADGDGVTPVPCGMIRLQGSCSKWCLSLGFGGSYPACVDRPGEPWSPMTSAVITTALP